MFSHTCSCLVPGTPGTILFRVLPSLYYDSVGCPLKPSVGCDTRGIGTLHSEPSRRFCKKCAVVSNISDFTQECGFCSTVKVIEQVIMYIIINWHFGWGNPKRRVFFSQQLSCMCRDKLPSLPRVSDGPTPYPPQAQRRCCCAVCPGMASTLHPAHSVCVCLGCSRHGLGSGY